MARLYDIGYVLYKLSKNSSFLVQLKDYIEFSILVDRWTMTRVVGLRIGIQITYPNI